MYHVSTHCMLYLWYSVVGIKIAIYCNTVTAAHRFIHEVKREKFIQYPYREMLCKCDQIAITNSKMFTLWFSNTKLYCFQ